MVNTLLNRDTFFPWTCGFRKSLMLAHESWFCFAAHTRSLRDTLHAVQYVVPCSRSITYTRALKKEKIFCIFSLLSIQNTQGWRIHLWHQGLFLKPWILWHTLAYLPALTLRWKLQKRFATDVSGTNWIFFPNTELLVDSQDAAPALSHQINDSMWRNISAMQSKMEGWIPVKVPHTVTLEEVAGCFLVSDNRTVKSSDCMCAPLCIKNTVLIPENN